MISFGFCIGLSALACDIACQECPHLPFTPSQTCKRGTGHSKGAGSVLLYSSKHDDIPNVVNVAGRFDMCTGVKERFGENIIERLASEKQIAMTIKRDDGKKIEWMLTKWSLQDRLDLNMALVLIPHTIVAHLA